MKIIRVSPVTGLASEMEIDVTPEQIKAWEGGTNIQDAMPHLSPDEREYIMTGLSGDEWADIMGPDEDDGQVEYLGIGVNGPDDDEDSEEYRGEGPDRYPTPGGAM